jgi:hypothetical protein
MGPRKRLQQTPAQPDGGLGGVAHAPSRVRVWRGWGSRRGRPRRAVFARLGDDEFVGPGASPGLTPRPFHSLGAAAALGRRAEKPESAGLDGLRLPKVNFNVDADRYSHACFGCWFETPSPNRVKNVALAHSPAGHRNSRLLFLVLKTDVNVDDDRDSAGKSPSHTLRLR